MKQIKLEEELVTKSKLVEEKEIFIKHLLLKLSEQVGSHFLENLGMSI